MATALTTGYIYFIEKNSGNQEWGHVPGNIDLDNFTEGTDFVKLQIPKGFKIKGKTGIIAYDSGSGRSYAYNTNRRAYATLADGVETTIAKGATVVNFFMLDSHCSGAAATYKDYYCVIKHAAGYYPFIDSSSTPRDYCRGVVLDWELDWDYDDQLRATVRINWRSMWK